jgi:hypothetical protein
MRLVFDLQYDSPSTELRKFRSTVFAPPDREGRGNAFRRFNTNSEGYGFDAQASASLR